MKTACHPKEWGECRVLEILLVLEEVLSSFALKPLQSLFPLPSPLYPSQTHHHTQKLNNSCAHPHESKSAGTPQRRETSQTPLLTESCWPLATAVGGAGGITVSFLRVWPLEEFFHFSYLFLVFDEHRNLPVCLQ